jgi:hypothetical protein
MVQETGYISQSTERFLDRLQIELPIRVSLKDKFFGEIVG